MEEKKYELPPEPPKTDLEKWLSNTPTNVPTNYELQQEFLQGHEYKAPDFIQREKQTKLTYSWEWKF